MSTEKLEDLEQPQPEGVKGGSDENEREPLVGIEANEFGAEAQVAGADASARLEGGRLNARIES